MMSLSAKHPQILDFISIKDDLNKINNANLSVEIDDDFMSAVFEYYNTGKRIPLHIPNSFKGGNSDGYTIYPIDIYKAIVKHAWQSGEPGVMFMNKFCNYNIMEFVNDYQIYTSNPCGEQPLPKHGSCNLCAINLSEYITQVNGIWKFNEDEFIEDVVTIVEEMDNIIDENITNHPLKEQQEVLQKYRNIGIGVMGLQDALMKLGYTYGDANSISWADYVFNLLFTSAVKKSSFLAKIKGSFPGYTEDVWNSTIMQQHFTQDEIKSLKSCGLRNCSLISVAPTGSIGTMFQVSTGTEPWFNLKYTRTTKSLDGGKESTFEVEAPIVKELKGKVDDKVFVTSQQIKWQDRIDLQAAMQRHVDTAISSTINLPKETTLEEIEQIYLYAWIHGLKGLTIFRDGCREGILNNIDTTSKEINPTLKYDYINRSAPKRPKDLKAVVEYVKVKGELFAVYTGFLNDKPYEIFARKSNDNIVKSEEGIITKKSKGIYSFKSENYQIDNLIDTLNTEEKAATLYTSMLLRHGINIKYIVKTTKKVNDNITSFCSAICRILSKYIPIEETGEKCPNCGSPIIKEGGCEHCSQCEWSRCMLSYNIPNTRKLNK